jgi:Ca2+-binding EF-hand superfamily protein
MSQIPPPHRQPSHDEIVAGIEKVLKQDVDQDKDGEYSTEELKKWLETVHHKVVAENINRQWAYYNPEPQEVHSWEGYAPEKKEVLHWEVYKNMTYPDQLGSADDDPSNPHYQSLVIMYKRAERRWALADANSDSVLTKEEYKDFVHPEESEKVRHIIVDEAQEDMDKDSDGSISLDEYMNHLKSMAEEHELEDPQWAQAQQNHFGSYLDKDKDGSLNKEELRDWLIPTYDKHENEALRLVTIADVNKDHQLSWDEIKTEHHHFYALLPPEFWTKYMTGDGTPKHDEF